MPINELAPSRAAQAFVTAALNRSFPVYPLVACLSPKEREPGHFSLTEWVLSRQGKASGVGDGKSQLRVFAMFAPLPSRDVFLSARRQKVWPPQAEFEKRTSFSLYSQSQLQANVFSGETLLLRGHSARLFCGCRERLGGQWGAQRRLRAVQFCVPRART